MMYYLGLQITLKLDPETEMKKYGSRPGPLDEIEVMVIAFLDNSTKLSNFSLYMSLTFGVIMMLFLQIRCGPRDWRRSHQLVSNCVHRWPSTF